MVILYTFRWCLSVCVLLQLQIFPMADAKVGNVSSSNISDVETSFSTVTFSSHDGQVPVSSTLIHTPSLFTVEISSTSTPNSINLFSSSVTPAAANNTSVASINDVISTTSVVASSISDSARVSVSGTVKTTNVYGSSSISLSSTIISVQSGSFSTYSVTEVNSTSVVTSQIMNEETISTSSETNTDTLNVSNTINATPTYTTTDIGTVGTSSVSEQLSSSGVNDITLQSSIADVSSSKVLELSTSIMTTSPILSETINISTTDTLVDVITTPSSYRTVSSAESTLMFQTEVFSQSTPLFNQTEFNQSVSTSSALTSDALHNIINATSEVASPTSVSSTVSRSLSTDHGYSDTSDTAYSSLSVMRSTSIVTTSSLIMATSSSIGRISNSIGTTASAIVTTSGSNVTTSSPIDTTSDSIITTSSLTETAASEILSSSSSLLTFITTSSATPEVHPSIQSSLQSSISPSIVELTHDLVSTPIESTGTPTLGVSHISGLLFKTSTVSSMEQVTLYPSTLRIEQYDSSSDLSQTSSGLSLQGIIDSTSASVVQTTTTSIRSSSVLPTSISPTSSSFVTSETIEGSHVSVSVTPDSTTTTPTVPDTSSEDSTNTTGPDERSQTRVMITFNGNCHLLRDSILLQDEFLKAWAEDVESRTGLDIDTDNVKMKKMLCDPFRVIVNLVVNDSRMLSSAQQDIVSSSFHVRIPDSVRELNFSSTRVEILDDIKVTDGIDDMSAAGHLEVADFVIISVASFLFAVLVVMLCVVMFRECYKRKRSSSFNLSDMPHISLKLSDFTLTKIPRPKVFYRENSKRKADRVPMTRVGPMSRHVNGPDVEDHYDKLNINADKIHVRMRDHAHGLVVGVLSSKHARGTRGTANDSSISDGSTRSDELVKKSLLSQDTCISCLGVNNPTFSNYDEEVNGNTKYTVQEEEIEHFL